VKVSRTERRVKELGNYRAIERKTGIPFISCYKNVQKSIAALRRMVKGEPEPILPKDELREAQKNTPQLNLWNG
jgi:hypothetical protein